MRVTVHSRTPGGNPIELANTPIIPAIAFTVGTEDLTFAMSSDVNPSESTVHLVMDEEGGLGYIQWQYT
jgi:hypothetical protein